MKKSFLRLVLVGLFALSLGTAGTIFAEVASAGPQTPNCGTVNCDGNKGCIGSTCDCIFDGGTSFHCQKPVL